MSCAATPPESATLPESETVEYAPAASSEVQKVAMEMEGKLAALAKRTAASTVATMDGATQKTVKQLGEAITAGVPARSAVYAQFVRACEADPKLQQELASLRGNKLRAAFRVKWAEGKLEAVKEEYKQRQTLSEVDASKGVFRTLLRIAKEEGGTEKTCRQHTTMQLNASAAARSGIGSTTTPSA